MTGRGLAKALLLAVVVGAGARGCVAFSQHAAPPQGYLGVELREVPDEQMSTLHMKGSHGVEITRVDHDGPAGKAGLREHDVVLQFNGQAIGSLERLRKLLRETTPGLSVSLLVLRDGQQQAVTAQMANREEVERRAWEQHITVVDPEGGPPPPPPADDGRPAASGMGFLHSAGSAGAHTRGFLGTMLGGPYTGAALEPVSPQLGEFFGVQSGVGLLVKTVDANSPAAVAGLRAGDVVLKANQVTMSTEGDWTRQLHESKGRSMPVLVMRDRHEQTLNLTPDAKRRSRNELPLLGSDRGTSPETQQAALHPSGLSLRNLDSACRQG